MTTDYNKQATDFLNKHGITFKAALMAVECPPWGDDDNRKVYRHKVTLTGKRGDCKRSLSFAFWGSIADYAAKCQDITPYDVLACISNDANTPETFKDFCDEYGYDTDSRKAEATFKRCLSFSKRMKAFFSEAELRDLSEIQ